MPRISPNISRSKEAPKLEPCARTCLRGVDTEYWRQSSRLYDIYLRFVLAYLDCYYPNKEVLTKDTEMRATARLR